jgi:transcriptional repressor NrdR
VIDSRSSDGGEVIRRRRECLACQKRYTTRERVEKTARLMVIKKDGTRVAFDRQNLLKGVQAACGKRPVPEADKECLVHEIEEEVHREFEREVPSREIGERVKAKLWMVDPIAYLRFASEYYQLDTLEEFEDILASLKQRIRDAPNQETMFSER